LHFVATGEQRFTTYLKGYFIDATDFAAFQTACGSSAVNTYDWGVSSCDTFMTSMSAQGSSAIKSFTVSSLQSGTSVDYSFQTTSAETVGGSMNHIDMLFLLKKTPP